MVHDGIQISTDMHSMSMTWYSIADSTCNVQCSKYGVSTGGKKLTNRKIFYKITKQTDDNRTCHE